MSEENSHLNDNNNNIWEGLSPKLQQKQCLRRTLTCLPASTWPRSSNSGIESIAASQNFLPSNIFTVLTPAALDLLVSCPYAARQFQIFTQPRLDLCLRCLLVSCSPHRREAVSFVYTPLPALCGKICFFSHHTMFNLLFSFQRKQDILFILEREGALVLAGQLQAHWCAHASRPLLSAGPIIQ